MSDSTSERNEHLKATMRQKETPLNKGTSAGSLLSQPSEWSQAPPYEPR